MQYLLAIAINYNRTILDNPVEVKTVRKNCLCKWYVN